MHVAIIRFIIALLVVVISCQLISLQLSAFSLCLLPFLYRFTHSPRQPRRSDGSAGCRSGAAGSPIHQILTPNPEPLPLLQRLAGNSGFQIGFYQGFPHNPYHRHFNIPGDLPHNIHLPCAQCNSSSHLSFLQQPLPRNYPPLIGDRHPHQRLFNYNDVAEPPHKSNFFILRLPSAIWCR